MVARIYTYWFDLPLYSMVPFITERLQLETDFVNEADNAERMGRLVAGEPRLRNRVYVPKVYRELSSKRIMTAEWIEGVRLWDKENLTKPWVGRWRQGSPGCGGAPLDPPNQSEVADIVRSNLNDEKLKPNRDWWKGQDGQGGLGLSLKDVMMEMIDLFSAQMFLWGWVHCDRGFITADHFLGRSDTYNSHSSSRKYLHPASTVWKTRACAHRSRPICAHEA